MPATGRLPTPLSWMLCIFSSGIFVGANGCALISEDALQDRLDLDGDGVARPLDCDDDDAGVGASADLYADADGDGFGGGEATRSCTTIAGFVADDSDCDDTDQEVYPGALERCDGVDNNCEDGIDEGSAADAATWYTDSDDDGFGDVGAATQGCSQPDGCVADATDCNDADPNVSPLGVEVCGGEDEDCDGEVDEDSAADAPAWAADLDGDGFGDASNLYNACACPGGYLDEYSDCDDTSSSAHPGGDEVCNNGIDEDCQSGPDDACMVVGARDISSADAIITGTNGLRLGTRMAAALPDADGACDLIAIEEDSSATHAWLIDGATSGSLTLSTTWAVEVSLPYMWSYAFGTGDVDGDGNTDLAHGGLEQLNLYLDPFAGSPSSSATLLVPPGVYITGTRFQDGDADVGIAATLQGSSVLLAINGQWAGSRDLADSDVLRTLSASSAGAGVPCGAAYTAVAGGQDYDGDGIDDVLIGDATADDCPAAYLLLGPLTGAEDVEDDADWMIAADSYRSSVSELGWRVDLAADADGDGLADIAVSAPFGAGVGQALLFTGGAHGVVTRNDYSARFTATQPDFLFMGQGMATPDIDGDGLSDMVLGSITDAGIWFGPFSGDVADTDADVTFAGSFSGSGLGGTVTNLGDVQGYGFDTVALSETSAASYSGVVYLVNGSGS